MPDRELVITAIIGSPRRGNTQHLTEVVETELKRLGGVRVEYLRLSEKRVEPCRGCSLCMTQSFEKCPIHDDVPEIVAAIEKSDGVILASPVYIYHVSGQIKVLLDRLAAFFHRPAFYGRHAMVLATTGFFGTEPTLKYMKSVLHALGFSTVVAAGGQGTDLERRYVAKTEERARKAARRFHRSLVRRGAFRPSFASVMQFASQRACFTNPGVGKLFPKDYEHYSALAGRSFPVDARIDPFTRAVAWIGGKVFRLIFRII